MGLGGDMCANLFFIISKSFFRSNGDKVLLFQNPNTLPINPPR